MKYMVDLNPYTYSQWHQGKVSHADHDSDCQHQSCGKHDGPVFPRGHDSVFHVFCSIAETSWIIMTYRFHSFTYCKPIITLLYIVESLDDRVTADKANMGGQDEV